MQFGVFTVGDETPDPPRGRAPSEAQRIAAMVAIAGKTEEVGLDVFATDKHHNPPFAMLQHLAGGRVDLMLGRGNTAPVHPWFGQDIRTGIPLAIESLRPAAPAVAGGGGRLGGPLPCAAAGLHLDPASAGRRATVPLGSPPALRRPTSRVSASSATASGTTNPLHSGPSCPRPSSLGRVVQAAPQEARRPTVTGRV